MRNYLQLGGRAMQQTSFHAYTMARTRDSWPDETRFLEYCFRTLRRQAEPHAKPASHSSNWGNISSKRERELYDLLFAYHSYTGQARVP